MSTFFDSILGRRAMAELQVTWKPSGRCTLVGVDVVGFGRPHANLQVQIYLRDRLYDVIGHALRDSGVEFGDCYSEDRGDGLVLAAPPEIPADRLIHPFVELVCAGLRRHNRVSNDLAQLRLRLAIHSTEAWTDAHGLVGAGVIDMFRLLDAPTFKEVVRQAHAYLALITSNAVYDQIIRHDLDFINPDDYSGISIQHKEMSGTAWVRLVGCSPAVGRSA